jgi:hypothetical protein
MAKYVKCIDNSGIPFTEGNCYTIVNSDRSSYLLTDDYGVLHWRNKVKFEEPYDLPDTITFPSQQEFEDAVMKVVIERLRVYNYVESPTGGGREEYLNIKDDL